jgi:hypothetical protein
MLSFFDDRDNVRAFSDGLDLLGDQSGSQIIADICVDVKKLINEDNDFYPAFFSLEALLTSLHDHKAAIDLTINYPILMEDPIFRFRHATHCLEIGNSDTADELFRSFRSKKPYSSRDDVLGLLAAGRLGDADEVSQRWKSLIKERGHKHKQIDDDFIQNPDPYTILADYPFRERIEGVRLLIRENIIAGREKEAFSLFRTFAIYTTGFLDEYLTSSMMAEGGERVIPGLWIATLISRTAGEIADSLLKADIFTSDILDLGATKDLIKIHEITREYLVKYLLLQAMVSGISNSDLLAAIRDVVPHRDELILGPLEWITMTEFKEQASSIISMILKDNPDLKRTERYTSQKIQDSQRFRDEYLYDKEDDQDCGEENLELASLLDNGHYNDAFELVSDYLKRDAIFEDIEIIFDIAIKSGRFDDLIPLRSYMEKGENYDGVYLIQAYQRLRNQDVKGCLSLIDRAVSAGYPKENAMILTAAYMNNAGYPKRAVSICEKLLNKQALSPDDIVPILVNAYRLLGKEKEAVELEQTYITSSGQ